MPGTGKVKTLTVFRRLHQGNYKLLPPLSSHLHCFRESISLSTSSHLHWCRMKVFPDLHDAWAACNSVELDLGLLYRLLNGLLDACT